MRNETAFQTPGIDPKHGLMRIVFFHRLVLVWRGLWSNWGWAEWSLAATTTLLLPKAPRGCAGGRSQKFTPNKGLPLSSWTSFMGSHQWMMDDTENGCKFLPYNRSYWSKNSQKKWIHVLVKKCLQIRPETKSSIFLLHLDSSFPRALAAGTCPPNY